MFKVQAENALWFKNYTANFRQWKAEGTHCKYLHSYIISFKVNFDRNFTPVFKQHPKLRPELREWFYKTFDHVTFVAKDDPYLKEFQYLKHVKLIYLTILKDVGCERFSEVVLHKLNSMLEERNIDLKVISVETFEHDKNSALYSIK